MVGSRDACWTPPYECQAPAAWGAYEGSPKNWSARCVFSWLRKIVRRKLVRSKWPKNGRNFPHSIHFLLPCSERWNNEKWNNPESAFGHRAAHPAHYIHPKNDLCWLDCCGVLCCAVCAVFPLLSSAILWRHVRMHGPDSPTIQLAASLDGRSSTTGGGMECATGSGASQAPCDPLSASQEVMKELNKVSKMAIGRRICREAEVVVGPWCAFRGGCAVPKTFVSI